jgi:hypothetical protein
VTGLDVLILESRHGAAKHHVEALRDAGHRVHMCHDDGSFDFPCRAITEGEQCPIDQGIDVALVVRRGVNPRPTPSEQGVSCAIRAGVPLIEDGPTVLDPYEPFLTLRVTGDVVASAEQAMALGDEELQEALRSGVTPTLARAGVDPTEFGCSFERDATHLRVELSIPAEAHDVEQALAVRVLDLLRDQRQTYEQIDVVFRPTGAD